MSDADDVLNDMKEILLENGDVFYIDRQTTVEDGMGKVKSVENTQLRIYGYIRDITKKDRKVNEMGLAVSGNRILYVIPEYEIVSGLTTTTYVVKEDDILIDRNNYKWRVVTIIHEPNWNDTEIYKKTVVKSIGLEGST